VKGTAVHITVKLGGALREKVSNLVDGETIVDVEPGTLISGVIEKLGLKPEDVKLVMHNHRASPYDEEVKDGDRLGLFPPQLAYNMYVALSFRSQLKPKDDQP
jgi:molybdopterin converting factor small subunit